MTSPPASAGGRAAKPGESISIFATGLGPTSPVWQAGEIPGAATRLRDAFSVKLGAGDLPASAVSYVGLVPGAISGLYQINLTVPAGMADGNAPIGLTVGGASSPSGTILPVSAK